MFRYTIRFSFVLLAGCFCWTPVSNAQRVSDRGDRAAPKNSIVATKDGVQLGITYFASDEGQDSVPVVLLHDYKESRMVFNGLARALQNPQGPDDLSLAVITFDFRGHGESKTIQGPGGQTKKIDAAKLRNNDYLAMVNFDMEAIRKFLVGKNDAGELNLNKLCLVGVGMGANVATYWAARDWSAPPLALVKQGQDVKGLVQVSPKWSYRSLPLVRPLKHPAIRSEISTMIVWGAEDRKANRDAKNIYKILERFHPEPPRDQLEEKKDLFEVELPTSLHGSELLTNPQFRMLPLLKAFIDARIVKKDYEWSKRRQE
jgi:pimeloyl-ACP methyl ester carboxylesterase